MKITYEPIEDSPESFTKAELYDFYLKIKSLYENDGQADEAIQTNRR